MKLEKKLQMSLADQLPTTGIREFVERLAKAHGVEYQRTGLDDFSEATTRVAGDDVTLDRTGKLLVALKKKNLITARQLAQLVTNYLTEEHSDAHPVRSRSISPGPYASLKVRQLKNAGR